MRSEYWKQVERDVAKWWKDRGLPSKRLCFEYGTRYPVFEHSDVDVKLICSNDPVYTKLRVDAKSSRSRKYIKDGKGESLRIRRSDCERLKGINQSIQFKFYNTSRHYTVIPSEFYLMLIKKYFGLGDFVDVEKRQEG